MSYSQLEDEQDPCTYCDIFCGGLIIFGPPIIGGIVVGVSNTKLAQDTFLEALLIPPGIPMGLAALYLLCRCIKERSNDYAKDTKTTAQLVLVMGVFGLIFNAIVMILVGSTKHSSPSPRP